MPCFPICTSSISHQGMKKCIMISSTGMNGLILCDLANKKVQEAITPCTLLLCKNLVKYLNDIQYVLFCNMPMCGKADDMTVKISRPYAFF